jgi:hypothetical protein
VLERLPEQSRIPALVQRIVAGHQNRAHRQVCSSSSTHPTRSYAGRRSTGARRAEGAPCARSAGARTARSMTHATVLRVKPSWKEAGRRISFDGAQPSFTTMRRAAAAGILRIALMHVGTDVVAAQYSVQCGQAWWLFKIGYDADYADCSPGQLLMQHTLRHARAAGLQRYELQGTTAHWTRMWACTEHTSNAVRVHGWQPAALATAGARTLSPAP